MEDYVQYCSKDVAINLAAVLVLAVIFVGSWVWMLNTQPTEKYSVIVIDTFKKDLQEQRELINKKIEDLEKQIQDDQVFFNETSPRSSRSSGSGVYY